MNTRTIFTNTILVTGACVALGAMADGMGDFTPIDDQALILQEFDRLHIETPVATDLAVMNVRVFGPDNELLLSKRSVGESVEFLVDSGLPNGEYRYETVSIFGNVDLSNRANYTGGETTLLRNFGTFTVLDGQISDSIAPDTQNLQNDTATLDDASLLDRMIKQAVNLAGITLDVLIPSAHAADLEIHDASPALEIDDTDDEDCTPDWDWSVNASGGSSNADLNNEFHIDAWSETAAGVCTGGRINMVTLRNDGGEGAGDSSDTLVVDSDGDIHWAQSRMNFDKGLSNLSIGTSTTGAEIVISASNPEIRFRDELFNDYMYANYDTDWFNIGYQGSNRVRFHVFSPTEAMVIDSGGNLSLGAGTSPAAALEVRRTNGTAQILVDENSGTTATRTLFKIENKGLTKFIINNTTGAEWAFANKGTSFRVSRQGSGQVEMEVFNSGNVTIAGSLTQNSDVNQKTNIESIDQYSILQRITEMPISQWQYKDTLGENHIGPMAQDFYAAFGLGQSETGLSSIDTAGVALAAIKALASENNDLRQQIQSQADRLEELESQQIMMQTMVSSILEAQQASPVLTKTAMN